jgi:phosphatidylinositol alpha 1,6-mannosyltransferase
VDLVDEGITGYLVPPGDGDALAARVARLAADPALRARMGEAGRRKVLGRGWAALTGELIDHYADVIAARAAPQELAA